MHKKTNSQTIVFKHKNLQRHKDKDSTCVIGSGGVVRQDQAGDLESRWVYFHFDCPLRMCRVPAPVFLIIFLEKVFLVIFLETSLSHYLPKRKPFSSSSSGLFPPTLGQKANHLWRSSGALEMTLSANYNDTIHSWAATATHLGIKYSQIVK